MTHEVTSEMKDSGFLIAELEGFPSNEHHGIFSLEGIPFPSWRLNRLSSKDRRIKGE